jgi:hypothetical protein
MGWGRWAGLIGVRDDKMKDLTGMTFGNRGTSEVIAGGRQDKLLRINLDRGTVVNEVGIYPDGIAKNWTRADTIRFLGAWKKRYWS